MIAGRSSWSSSRSPLREEEGLLVGRRFACRLHEQLAQSWGADIAVTIVLVPAGTDQELSASRLGDLAGRSPGLGPAVAVSGGELGGHTVSGASAAD